MKRAVLLFLTLACCRDWAQFSAHYGDDGGSSAGGGVAGGGSAGGTAGGAAGGSAGGAAGGSAGGNAGGSAGGSAGGTSGGSGGGAVDDPLSCTSARGSTCPAGNLFCDGFEGTLTPTWNVDTLNGTATIVDTCSFRGGHALKVALSAVGAGVNARAKVVELASGGPATQYVRAFVRVNSATTPAFRILEVRQMEPATGDARLVLTAGQLSAGASSGSTPTSTASFPTNRWVCVEWKLVDGTPGSQTVWLDGTQVISGPLEVRSLVRVGAGAQLMDHASTATPGVEAWFDEVVVDDAPIGCAN